MAEKMKDSGIEWIGKIPEGWEVKKIRFVSKTRSEKGLYNPEKDRYIGLEHIESSCGRLCEADSFYEDEAIYDKFYKGDLLFNKLRPYLEKIYIAEFDGFCTSELINFKYFDGYTRYFYYVLFSNRFLETVNSSTYGTKMPRASWDFIKNLKIPLPPASEQKRIADYLDAQTAKIDAIIKTNEEQLELLKKYKKSLITQTVTKGLDKTAKTKDSGIAWIGQIPAGWEMQRLKYVLVKNNPIRVGPFGTALTTSDYIDEGQWVYNQRVVLDKNFEENDTFISEEKAKELKGFKVFPGDLLITTRGTIGKVAKVPANCKDGVLHPCIIRFRVDESKLPYKLINVLFNESDFVLDQITRFSNATTIDVIYSETLKNLIVPIIPKDELNVIADYLDTQCAKIDSLIAKKQEAISTMQKYKKSLIYEYVTGKKRLAGD